MDDPRPSRSKAEWRRSALARRRARSVDEIAAARAAISAHLRIQLAGANVVGCYLPLPSEPLDRGLPAALHVAGVRVLLPIAHSGAALDWAEYTTETAVRRGAFGIDEPAGRALGADAIADADVVLVPALLVDRSGVRLGRGGGHYDRTLSVVRGDRIAVLFDDDLVQRLPAEDFDVPMTATVTPSGGVRRVDGAARH
ncbi:MAG: 5-formyltetrahydrofolate cyclo-ligase [Actinomycetota bacterium]|nr:5-formyltetrahydrofolate cyclo-ligase [Actinomycetota bacterium]